MWPDKPSKESPEAGIYMGGSVLTRGLDSSPCWPIWGPAGSVRSHFPIVGVPHYVPLLYPVLSALFYPAV